ncbi:hypothetical protein EJ06DRAFT_531603 [Trichodelitschia bisporula]|uniref:DAPG hydrolase PhiG domain-containing protein n=1 Tax=Trichodelitschia bisporula TaxID=703511 RepID=A0A6G1HU72_9PEZI|nr:hypothetical protein EJ06DRAFT_531603 [Trichodelitschia bisporula]
MALTLAQAPRLLDQPYSTLESGWTRLPSGELYIAAHTFMPAVTSAMIDWWFGYIHSTADYALWHPYDHISSAWAGPRLNNSTYIGGHHLVEERIGGQLQRLRLSFVSPGVYFGPDWERKFREHGWATAVCARVGTWDGSGADAPTVRTGHVIHLVRDEAGGARMRSRFWVGDVEGLPAGPEGVAVREGLFRDEVAEGLLRHASEEMAFLGNVLPGMYARHSRDGNVVKAKGKL